MDRAKAADRIAKLRAKADSTTFPAEADALRAKADELEQMFGFTSNPRTGARGPGRERDQAWHDLFEQNRRNMAGAGRGFSFVTTPDGGILTDAASQVRIVGNVIIRTGDKATFTTTVTMS